MSTDKIIIKNALITTFLIGGFFLLCNAIGLGENPYLRFLNLAFVLIGIYLAIKESVIKNNETLYTTNLGIGIRTSVLAVALSIIGVIIYIQFINPSFIDVMNSSFLIGGNLSLAEIVITLVIEGMASSFIGSFIIMQFYKKPEKLKTAK
ncbi:hypothetical protein [Polaribacter sp.]|uniref:hypothetical protein n=1 Tax=Polaribacter sp. TaxID=1920175 RepID=UPI003F6C6C62